MLEHANVCWEIVPYTGPVTSSGHGDRGKVLDVGSGDRKAFPHFVGVDTHEKADYKVADCAVLSDFEDEQCDAVFAANCLNNLEHATDALREWMRVVKPGGHVIIYGPSKNHNPEGRKASTVALMVAALIPGGWTLMEYQERAAEEAFLVVFRKRTDGVIDEEAWARAQTQRLLTKKRCCVVRYGGFGDMLQVAAILPALKREGWHITVMTEPKGRDVIAHDPNVDDFFIQANDQVPNPALGDFWKYWEKRFDKFVNFSESIEGTLLAMPDRIQHRWPLAVRQKHLNRNYFEWMAELAGVEYTPEGQFYPTAEEEAWAKKTRFDMNGFVVAFVLSGSSVHKYYRWQDEVIGGLLRECPKARVVTMGDAACKILEQGWENESRVIRTSGEWSIRQTLAFAREANAVFGPETGVLNSVANDDMLKVVLLSHSSAENLTKHWTNTVSLEPAGQHCYPCHQLHYSTEFCDIDLDTGTAMCQVRIAPERALYPLLDAYRAWEGNYYGRPRKPVIPVVVMQ